MVPVVGSQRVRRARIVALGAGICVASVAGEVEASTPTPVEDRFAGRITGGAGHYRNEPGHLRIVVHVTSDGARFSLALHGRHCRVRRCLSPSGRLTGSATPLKRTSSDVPGFTFPS